MEGESAVERGGSGTALAGEAVDGVEIEDPLEVGLRDGAAENAEVAGCGDVHERLSNGRDREAVVPDAIEGTRVDLEPGTGSHTPGG